jgi:hypothetical protein
MKRTIAMLLACSLPATTAETQGIGSRVGTRLTIDERALEPRLLDAAKRGLTRRYYVYTYRRAPSTTRVDYRAWKGLLGLRAPTAGRRRVALKLFDERQRRIVSGKRQLISGWFKEDDGSISKEILNRGNQPVGRFNLDHAGTKTLSFDLDGDGLLEFLSRLESSGRLQVFASENEGLRFYRELLQGRSACDKGSRAAAVAPDPHFDLFCGRRSIGGGTTGAAGAVKGSASGDSLDAMCTKLTAKPSLSTPLHADASELIGDVLLIAATELCGVACGLFLTIVTYPSTARAPSSDSVEADEAVRADHEVRAEEETPADTEPPVNVVYIEDAVVIESSPRRSPRDSTTATGGSRRQLPGPDSDSGLDSLRQICVARQALARRWKSFDIKHAANCPDSYVVPVPGPADQPMMSLATCTDEDEPLLNPRKDFAGAGANCGPLAQPGPDGRCQGRGMFVRSGSGARGSYAFAAGAVVGIEPCDPRYCDPP